MSFDGRDARDSAIIAGSSCTDSMRWFRVAPAGGGGPRADAGVVSSEAPRELLALNALLSPSASSASRSSSCICSIASIPTSIPSSRPMVRTYTTHSASEITPSPFVSAPSRMNCHWSSAPKIAVASLTEIVPSPSRSRSRKSVIATLRSPASRSHAPSGDRASSTAPSSFADASKKVKLAMLPSCDAFVVARGPFPLPAATEGRRCDADCRRRSPPADTAPGDSLSAPRCVPGGGLDICYWAVPDTQ